MTIYDGASPFACSERNLLCPPSIPRWRKWLPALSSICTDEIGSAAYYRKLWHKCLGWVRETVLMMNIPRGKLLSTWRHSRILPPILSSRSAKSVVWNGHVVFCWCTLLWRCPRITYCQRFALLTALFSRNSVFIVLLMMEYMYLFDKIFFGRNKFSAIFVLILLMAQVDFRLGVPRA